MAVRWVTRFLKPPSPMAAIARSFNSMRETWWMARSRTNRCMASARIHRVAGRAWRCGSTVTWRGGCQQRSLPMRSNRRASHPEAVKNDPAHSNAPRDDAEKHDQAEQRAPEQFGDAGNETL